MTDPLNPQGSDIPTPDGGVSDPMTDSSLGGTMGDDATLTDGEPLPDDQGGLSTDDGSQSDWDSTQDLSVQDAERESAQPNQGRPVTDDQGRLHPETDPMSNDNR